MINLNFTNIKRLAKALESVQKILSKEKTFRLYFVPSRVFYFKADDVVTDDFYKDEVEILNKEQSIYLICGFLYSTISITLGFHSSSFDTAINDELTINLKSLSFKKKLTKLSSSIEKATSQYILDRI